MKGLKRESIVSSIRLCIEHLTDFVSDSELNRNLELTEKLKELKRRAIAACTDAVPVQPVFAGA